MVGDGADILDVGGSHAAQAEPLPEDEELRRVPPVVERLVARVDAPISIDTYKASVARPRWRLARPSSTTSWAPARPDRRGRGRDRRGADPDAHPRTIEGNVRSLSTTIPSPRWPVNWPRRSSGRRGGRVTQAIVSTRARLRARGAQLRGLARLDTLAALDRPVLSGPSRKSFLKAALGERAPSDREWGTAAAVVQRPSRRAHRPRARRVRDGRRGPRGRCHSGRFSL
jgi:dihydropteroate synthase